jgi:Family of unknown function (DUF6544)
MGGTPAARGLVADLSLPSPAGAFSERELDGLPKPIRRYFRAAVALGAPLAASARLRMRGTIKLGPWLPFRARQVLAPHRGFIWAARVAGIISGSDQYIDGSGLMQWRLLGLVPIVRAEGPDISRSSVGRFGAESIWLPTSLLPRFGVAWTADDDSHVTARFHVDDVELALHLSLDDRACVRSVQLDRWGDPESSGAFGWHSFGIEVDGYATFDGVSIANRGRGGWFFGTDGWPEGDFFHYEITDLSLQEPRRREP